MLENCKNAKERWGGVNKIIDRWLKARQEIIVQFCDLSKKESQEANEEIVEQLQSFCQQLLDYVSAGHFEVYEQLVAEASDFNNGEAIRFAKKIMPKLEENTAAAVKYNDRFDLTEKSVLGVKLLLDDLSQLGETLEERFEMEDSLIEALHNVHADSAEVH